MKRPFSIVVLLIFSVSLGYWLSQQQHYEKNKGPFIASSRPASSSFEKIHSSLTAAPIPHYPWGGDRKSKISPITKEYFRCKGSSIHPPIPIMHDGKIIENIFDCGGADSHGLPIRYGSEFIYPILIELLNEIQAAVEKPVVITSGHRCPVHNAYIDRSGKNQSSKHQIGAEVSFYVAGLQNNPEEVLRAIFSFYTTNPQYSSEKDAYRIFERYDKEVDVVTKPWFNKEIFIKYYTATEGRNVDNRHPYPYFSIQVRFDKNLNMKVAFSPEDARHFHRK